MQPLQDNVALWARSVSKQSGVLKWILSYHLAHVANLIVIFICMCFSAAWDQVCSVRLEIEYHTFSQVLHFRSQHVQHPVLAVFMLRLHSPSIVFRCNLVGFRFLRCFHLTCIAKQGSFQLMPAISQPSDHSARGLCSTPTLGLQWLRGRC